MNGTHKLELDRVQKRAFMFQAGILNRSFEMLEMIEAREEDYVEEIMPKYIKAAAEYIQKLEDILITQPLDDQELGRLMMKMLGASASVGAEIVVKAINEMLEIYHSNTQDTYRCASAVRMVKAEIEVFKSYFEPYLEVLAKLRGEAPPADSDDE